MSEQNAAVTEAVEEAKPELLTNFQLTVSPVSAVAPIKVYVKAYTKAETTDNGYLPATITFATPDSNLVFAPSPIDGRGFSNDLINASLEALVKKTVTLNTDDLTFSATVTASSPAKAGRTPALGDQINRIG